MITKIYKYYLMPNDSSAVITVKGYCMHPILQNDWKVKIEPTDAKSVNTGDRKKVILINGKGFKKDIQKKSRSGLERYRR